MKMGMQAFYW
jgi:hypothetical protein